jgi:glutaminase
MTLSTGNCDMSPAAAAEAFYPRSRSSPILSSLQEIHRKYQNNFSGKVATYIPELAKADPRSFGIALVTADGQSYEVGDTRSLFTIQSISKVFLYALALEDHGVNYLLSKVGVEPSGEAFNSIVLDERHNRPFNPMVNAGAIATTALIKGQGHDARLARLLDKFADFAGHRLAIDHAVYRSELTTGHRNRAIAYLELNSGMIDDRVEEHLDLYFEQCSILVSARDLAVMAATLANGGVNPVTGKRAMQNCHVKNVLSVMQSCGMYDYAGEWNYRIGLPAKSGVGGGIIAVLPGQLGLGTFSPLLDDQGNSCRGIQACEEISRRFRLHMFNTGAVSGIVLRRSYRGNIIRSKRMYSMAELSILTLKGSVICVFELQGALHFGTMEQLLRRIDEEVETFSYLILDLKKVFQIDECARLLLCQLHQSLAARSTNLILSGLANEITSALKEGSGSETSNLIYFTDTDSALEWCEDRLLRADGTGAPARGPLSLAEMDILSGMGAGDIALLQSLVEQAGFEAGDVIIEEGDSAEGLFFIAEGSVTVCLRMENNAANKRISTITPGLVFGELALLDGGTRSADVIADGTVKCYVLPVAKLEMLAQRHPAIHTQLMLNIARELSARLRRADAEIRSLAE